MPDICKFSLRFSIQALDQICRAMVYPSVCLQMQISAHRSSHYIPVDSVVRKCPQCVSKLGDILSFCAALLDKGGQSVCFCEHSIEGDSWSQSLASIQDCYIQKKLQCVNRQEYLTLGRQDYDGQNNKSLVSKSLVLGLAPCWLQSRFLIA